MWKSKKGPRERDQECYIGKIPSEKHEARDMYVHYVEGHAEIRHDSGAQEAGDKSPEKHKCAGFFGS